MGIMVMEFDGSMVSANIPKLNRAINMGAEKGVLDAAMEIMRLSQIKVPHDEGTLQNTGTVEVMPNGDAVLGYHTPYAARLHEHPEYRFQKGRKGKYIEDPIEKNAEALKYKFEKAMGDELDNG
jgi:hypothetical protein